MSFLRRVIYGKDPAKMVIKKKAHTFTTVCVVWCFFSLVAVLFFREGQAGRDEAGVYIALVAWALHLVFIGTAVWFWVTEEPKEVDVIETNTDIG
ncbi:hypothetical protein MASR2M8_02530 [Opitutaceae bacterium]